MPYPRFESLRWPPLLNRDRSAHRPPTSRGFHPRSAARWPLTIDYVASTEPPDRAGRRVRCNVRRPRDVSWSASAPRRPVRPSGTSAPTFRLLGPTGPAARCHSIASRICRRSGEGPNHYDHMDLGTLRALSRSLRPFSNRLGMTPYLRPTGAMWRRPWLVGQHRLGTVERDLRTGRSRLARVRAIKTGRFGAFRRARGVPRATSRRYGILRLLPRDPRARRPARPALLPIGSSFAVVHESVHMNPEEAVQEPTSISRLGTRSRALRHVPG